ncbi:MAG TPA: VCBS repeat-containing protein [Candidatus Manganitrophaceae bacterium]|nr:VCBS repeat-containing protein [Candidatus Manganitrophaceae bacterium]
MKRKRDRIFRAAGAFGGVFAALCLLSCGQTERSLPSPGPLEVDLIWSGSGENQPFARFGSALASGDFNGDGWTDLLVAAGSFNTGRPNAGKVFLFLGTASGLSEKAAWAGAGDDQEGAYFGSSIAVADVDRDGFSDAVIGASDYDDGKGRNVGKAYLYMGKPEGLSRDPSWTSSGENQSGAFYGISAAGAGDVNGDGFEDVLVGASGYSDRGESVGKAYLYLGGKEGLAAGPAWTSMGDRMKGSGFGFSLGAAGDVNHDGYDDILIGAPRFYGKVFIYPGAPRGPRSWPIWTASGHRQGGSAFGMTLAGLHDVNGDRFPDLAVGAPFEDTPGHTDAGKAFLFLGSPWGISVSAGWGRSGDDQIDAKYGTALIPVGDVNRDGYDDLLVGAKAAKTGPIRTGRATLYLGGPRGLGAPAWSGAGEGREDALFGAAGAPYSSKNFSGFVVGAPHYSSDSERAGKVYLYRAQSGAR